MKMAPPVTNGPWRRLERHGICLARGIMKTGEERRMAKDNRLFRRVRWGGCLLLLGLLGWFMARQVEKKKPTVPQALAPPAMESMGISGSPSNELPGIMAERRTDIRPCEDPDHVFETALQLAAGHLEALEYQQALDVLDRLAGTGGLIAMQQKRLNDEVRLLDRLLRFERRLAEKNAPAAISLGRILLASPDLRLHAPVLDAVSRQLEQLRAALLPRTEEFRLTAESALQQARAAAMPDYSQVQALADRKAMNALVVLDFLDPDPRRAAQMEPLFFALDAYIRATLDKAYERVQQERPEDAAALFKDVVAVATEGDPYYWLARQELKSGSPEAAQAQPVGQTQTME